MQITHPEILAAMPSMLRYAAKLAGRQEAEDIVHETVLRILDKEVAHKSNITGYLCSMVYGTYIERISHNKHVTRYNRERSQFTYAGDRWNGELLSRAVNKVEEQLFVKDCFSMLTVPQQQLLTDEELGEENEKKFKKARATLNGSAKERFNLRQKLRAELYS